MKHITIGLFVFILGIVMVLIVSVLLESEFNNILLFSIVLSILYISAVIGVSTSMILEKLNKIDVN